MMTLVDDVRVYDGYVYLTDWAEAAGYDVEELVLDDERPAIEDRFVDWAEENGFIAEFC
jgi:hypothetical protein